MIAPELHALLHNGSASWLFHRSCKDNAFLKIITEMPFFFTHLEIQKCHIAEYFWSRMMLLAVHQLTDRFIPSHAREDHSVTKSEDM